jgi:hypothetical protein
VGEGERGMKYHATIIDVTELDTITHFKLSYEEMNALMGFIEKNFKPKRHFKKSNYSRQNIVSLDITNAITNGNFKWMSDEWTK